MFAGMDWAEPEGTFYVQFSHEGVATEPHDRVHGVVDSRVAQWEFGDVDAVIHAAARGMGEVHD